MLTAEREKTFHDAWASSTRPEEVRVREAFEGPTALENRFILGLFHKTFGGLRSVRLLDIGCGLGESSAYFAGEGALVIAIDLSPEMARTAEKVAVFQGTRVAAVVASADELPFGGGSFDAVYVANAVHHLPDREKFFREVHRVLRPGGIFASWDPLRYNPVINAYRRMATDVRTADERPLGFETLDIVRDLFPRARFRCFWIATLALFLKFYLVDRVHPNADRYWKRIYRVPEKSLWWWKPLRLLDRLLTRIPGVRALAWNIVIWGKKGPWPVAPAKTRALQRCNSAGTKSLA